jgi:CrcB protein
MLIAYFMQIDINPNIKLFLVTGFLGALTTYSTFAIDTVLLLKSSIFLAFYNIVINLLGSIFSAFIGYKLLS